jgi:CHAT domain-containing protein/predicted negative regulator of RcsB-dependent stress response
MSIQNFKKCGFIIVSISLFYASRGLCEKESQTAETDKFRRFYQMLAEIKDDSNAIQLTKLEAFVKSCPEFAPGAAWLFNKYVLDGDLPRAEGFFSNLPNSGLSLRTKNWMLGQVYYKRERTEEALIAFTRALAVASPPPELILDFLIFDSRSLRKADDETSLKQLFQDQKTLFVADAFWDYLNFRWTPTLQKLSRLPDVRENLTTLYIWGYCFERTNQILLAKEKWQKGLSIARAVAHKEFEGRFHLSLGIVAPTLEMTLAYWDSSYAIAGEIGELRQLEYLAGNSGILNSRLGNIGLAESLLLEAIETGRQLRSPWTVSEWHLWYGNALVQQDRFDEAFAAYDTSAELSKRSRRADIVIGSQIRQGELYRLLGQFDLARRTLEGAYIEATKRNWPLLETFAHIEIAHLNLETGKQADARHIYSSYFENAPKTLSDAEDHAWWRIQCGRSYLAEHQYPAAHNEFSEAFSLADKSQSHYYAALALLCLAEIDLVGNDLQSAHQRLDDCIAICAKTDLGRILPALHSLRGEAFKKAGELVKAITHYKKAANLIEQTRESLTSETSKLNYFGDKADIYDKLVDCYREIYHEKDDDAYLDSLYLYMEMKRGRTLRELRAANGTAPDDSDSRFRREKLLEATKRLQSRQRYLRDYGALFTTQEMDSVSVQVQTAKLSVIAQKLRLTQGTTLLYDSLLASIPSLEELGDVLRDNESAIILYHLTENPFALVLTGNATEIVSLPTTVTRLRSSIQSLLNPFHRVTDDRTDAVFRADLAYELYQNLIASIEKVLQLPPNLLIAPEGDLANLPFELMLTARPDRSEFATTDSATYSDDFLIQRYSIGYIPNASFLFETEGGITPENVLVFADPIDEAPLTDGRLMASLRAGLNFDPLIYSSLEAKGIQTLHSNTTVCRREEATKESLFQEMPHYNVIHFATHAFVDTTHDAFSGLVLSTSDDKNDDGILMGYEIADLKLNADLVALSACETGRGKMVAGEGVLGLPRLFLGAGANTVLMTHWKVDDKFAADLMVKFYDYYLKQGRSKAEALTEAKRSVLSTAQKSGEVNYHHPLFWASFAMYGEPGFGKPARRVEVAIAAAGMLVLFLAGFRYRSQLRNLYRNSFAAITHN